MATAATTKADRRGRAPGTSSRARLLAAAAKIFAERGFAAATVDDVAAAAGLSKGAVYWNFASKEELFLALYDERIDRRNRAMIELLRTAPAGEDMAPEASRYLGELLAEERDVVLIAHEHWALAVRDQKLRTRQARRGRQLRAALAEALEARRERLGAPAFATPPEEVVTAYVALADGLSLLKLVDGSAVPDHLFGEVVALVYQGLVARAERDRRPGERD